MPFVNLAGRGIHPKGSMYSVRISPVCLNTLFFIVHSEDSKKFATTLASFNFGCKVDISDEQDIEGLSGGSFKSFSIHFTNISDQGVVLVRLVGALKKANFYQMKSN